jgi:hypothetical protein
MPTLSCFAVALPFGTSVISARLARALMRIVFSGLLAAGVSKVAVALPVTEP